MSIKLESLPIFRNLPISVVTRILKQTKTKDYQPGEMIIRQGEMGQEFFVLMSGTAEVVLPGGERKRLTEPGTAFGEIALIERVKRTASVRAVDKVTVVVMEKKYFDLLFLHGSEERKTLTQNIRATESVEK